MARRSLGPQFGWLWTAYAVSAYGSGLGFGAFPLIAVLVLHAPAAGVSALFAGWAGGGAGGRGADRAAARAVGRVPAQAADDDHDGSGPVRGDDDDSGGLRVRPAQ